MKYPAFLLSSILVAGLSLSLPAFGQDDKQKQTPPQSQTQPANGQSQTQPATDQSQTPTASGQDSPDAGTAQSDDQKSDDQVSNNNKGDKKSKDSDKSDKKDKDSKDSDSKAKHDGGKTDVDSIGNRKVGGMDWYSIETDIKIGKTYAQQLESSMKMVQDPVVTEYVNRVGQNLVRNSDAKVPFTIKVVDADDVNAMALPGGFFYVNSGLILAADDEAELAAVMAHEIAHVALRHGTRGQTRADIANIATIPLIFLGGGIGYAARQAAGIGLPLTFLKFSRGFEAEADYFGLEYMYKAGYDPNAFVTIFEKLQALEKKKPGSLAKAFSTHPQLPDRVQKSQEEIATVLPARDQYITTTSEFNDVKARLAALENRHKVDDPNNANKPTLRRTAKDTSKDGDKKQDDDRPTLKRRDQ
jgi:beta-barrel assembly-enhancing protease